MLKLASVLVSLAAAAVIAMPTSAGDFGHNSFSRHGGKVFIGHRTPMILGRPFRGLNHGRPHFADGYGRFGYGHGRTPLIKRASFPYRGYNGYGGGYGDYGGRNVIVVVAPQSGGSVGGTYAGSSYVYDSDGGTYAVGSNYGFPVPVQTTGLAPMAKVISVTAKSSACSYEAGVCVIRP